MLTTWTVRSMRQLGVVYVVTRDDGGNFSCSCPAFEYWHQLCKHIRRIKMGLTGEKQKNTLPGVIT
jgi:hypothetical protein